MFGLTTKFNKMQEATINHETPAIGNVLLCEGLSCPECSKAMEQVDTTYSNTKTHRAEIGQHTGDIYFCEHCEQHYIDNLLSGNIEAWSY
jgi:uncharacterized protein with PIN domain